jgi:hypothetical protein
MAGVSTKGLYVALKKVLEPVDPYPIIEYPMPIRRPIAGF